MTNRYDIGDLVDMTGTFTDPDSGVLVDPISVICTVLSSDGVTETVPVVTRESQGVYLASIAPNRAGTWWYSFDGTGGEQASGEREFWVRKRRVPR